MSIAVTEETKDTHTTEEHYPANPEKVVKHECDMCGIVLVVDQERGEVVRFENTDHLNDGDAFQLEKEVGEEFGLHRIHHLTEHLTPGDITPSGQCPLCRTLCYPVEVEPHFPEARIARAEKALKTFIDTIESTGGVVADSTRGVFLPNADREWIDLGDAYSAACQALGRELKVSEIWNGDDEDDENVEDLADGRTRRVIDVAPVMCFGAGCNGQEVRQVAVYSDLPNSVFCGACDYELDASDVINIGCLVDNGQGVVARVIGWGDADRSSVVVEFGPEKQVATWDVEAIDVADEPLSFREVANAVADVVEDSEGYEKLFDADGNCIACLHGECPDCDGSIPCSCRAHSYLPELPKLEKIDTTELEASIATVERIAKEFENKKKPRIIIDARNGLVNHVYAPKALIDVQVLVATELAGTSGRYSDGIQLEDFGIDAGEPDDELQAAIEQYEEEPDPNDDTECPDCGSKWDAGGPLAGTVCPVCHRGIVEVQR